MASVSQLRRMMQMATPHQETVTGDVASFVTDFPAPAMMKAEFSPVQDLHGYDHPWPAGGGKNLLNNTAVTTTSNGVTFTVNSDGTVSTQGTASGGVAVLKIWQTFDNNADLIINGCPSGGNYASGYSMIVATSLGQPISDASYGIDTGSGYGIPAEYVSRIAQVQIIVRNGTNVSGKVFKPMIRLASVSDDTYAPYSNVCPITGWTDAEVTRTGANLWNYIPDGTTTKIGFTDLGDGGLRVEVLDTTASRFTAPNKLRLKDLKLVGGETYTIWQGVTSPEKLKFIVTNGAGGGHHAVDPAWTFTYAASMANYELAVMAAGGSWAVGDTQVFYPQLVKGSSIMTPWKPFTPQTIAVDWEDEAGTQYGGYIQINEDGTGTLVADTKGEDITNWTWNYYIPAENVNTFNHTISGAAAGKQGWFDRYKYYKASYIAAQQNLSFYFYNQNASQVRISVRDDRYTSADDFKASLNGAFLVYPLATPITYTLTASQVKTLLGTNNVWTSMNGSVTVGYFKHG